VRRRASALTCHSATARRMSRAASSCAARRAAGSALDILSQRKLSAGLCSLIERLFKVLRTQIAQGRMPTDSIVIALDIVEALRSRLLDIGERTAFEQLCFISRKEALSVGVVVGLIGATHTLLESVLLEEPSELRVHVLPTAIGMHDQPCWKM